MPDGGIWFSQRETSFAAAYASLYDAFGFCCQYRLSASSSSSSAMSDRSAGQAVSRPIPSVSTPATGTPGRKVQPATPELTITAARQASGTITGWWSSADPSSRMK